MPITTDDARDALHGWARQLPDRPELSVKAYEHWRRRNGGPSAPTVAKRLSGTTKLLSVLADHASELAEIAGQDLRVRATMRCTFATSTHWTETTLGEWAELGGRCPDDCAEGLAQRRRFEERYGGATIREAYPHLVEQLVQRTDADKTVRQCVDWELCRPEWVDLVDHRPQAATAEMVAADEAYCGGCRLLGERYAKWPPGSLIDDVEPANVSRTEQRVRRLLSQEHADAGLRWDVGVAVHLSSQHPSWRFRPDFVHPATRTVIEIDGATGHEGRYGGRHGTAQGREQDAIRDRALDAVGWSVVRLSDPSLEPLESPARQVAIPLRKTADVVEAMLAALGESSTAH